MLGPVVVVDAESVGNYALGFLKKSFYTFWTKKRQKNGDASIPYLVARLRLLLLLLLGCCDRRRQQQCGGEEDGIF